MKGAKAMKDKKLSLVVAAMAMLAIYVSVLTDTAILGTAGVGILVALFVADKEFRRMF